jgi:hypothetical protein
MLDLLITLLIFIVIFAVISYAMNTFLPLEPGIKNLILLIVGVIFVIWLLTALVGVAPVHVWRRGG